MATNNVKKIIILTLTDNRKKKGEEDAKESNCEHADVLQKQVLDCFNVSLFHDVQDLHEHADLDADHNHGDYDVEDLLEADVDANHDVDHLPMIGGQLERGLFTCLNGRDHLEIKFHCCCNLVDHEDRAVVDQGDHGAFL